MNDAQEDVEIGADATWGQRMLRSKLFRFLRGALVCPSAVILLNYQAVAPVGHWMLLFLLLPFFMIAIFAIPGFFLCLGLLLVKSCRAVASYYLAVCIVYPPLIVGGLLIGDNIRQSAFRQLAERSRPLVEAVHKFEAENGNPPSKLDELIPKYLPKIPRTGMMAYPTYEYRTGRDADRFNNPWVLMVSTPSGGINFDLFLYFPNQDYPARGYGGSLQRMGDWAYVHE